MVNETPMHTGISQAGLDALGYMGGGVLALSLVPQIAQLLITRSAADISLMWSLLYLLGTSLSFVYLLLMGAVAAWVPVVVEIAGCIIIVVLKLLDDYTSWGKTKELEAEQQQAEQHIEQLRHLEASLQHLRHLHSVSQSEQHAVNSKAHSEPNSMPGACIAINATGTAMPVSATAPAGELIMQAEKTTEAVQARTAAPGSRLAPTLRLSVQLPPSDSGASVVGGCSKVSRTSSLSGISGHGGNPPSCDSASGTVGRPALTSTHGATNLADIAVQVPVMIDLNSILPPMTPNASRHHSGMSTAGGRQQLPWYAHGAIGRTPMTPRHIGTPRTPWMSHHHAATSTTSTAGRLAGTAATPRGPPATARMSATESAAATAASEAGQCCHWCGSPQHQHSSQHQQQHPQQHHHQQQEGGRQLAKIWDSAQLSTTGGQEGHQTDPSATGAQPLW